MMQRIRGVFGTALTWGATWAIAGLAQVSVALAFFHPILPTHILLSDVLIQAPLGWGLFGALSGTAFAITTTRLARRGESVESLSMENVTGWGALGGAVIPVALTPVLAFAFPAAVGPVLEVAAVGAILGAASAGASLRLARRARDPQALPNTEFHFLPSFTDAALLQSTALVAEAAAPLSIDANAAELKF